MYECLGALACQVMDMLYPSRVIDPVLYYRYHGNVESELLCEG